jgi:hypothetical protein
VDLDGVPADYRIAVPESWFCVPLEPGERERAVALLANQQLNNMPALKRQLRAELDRHAAAAYQAGGIELYLSMMRNGPVTVPASLVITLVPPPPSGRNDPQTLARLLTSAAQDPRPEIAEMKHPAGPSVRAVRIGQGLNLDVYVQVPGSGAWLRLSFATPLTELAGPMRTLFETIAATLRWR